MGRYVFSQEAGSDLKEIYRYSFLNYGEKQAELYKDALKEKCQLLADSPYICRERDELTPPVRIHHHKKHLTPIFTEGLIVIIIP